MGGIVSCFSNFLVTAEKLSLWITCTVLICCLITTITIILGLGIGLGYNYCFIDMLTRYPYVPAHYVYSGSPRWRHAVVDHERRLGPQPVKMTIKPNPSKYASNNAPRPPSTTIETTESTTTTTESTTTTTDSTTSTTTTPPPTTTAILTPTELDIQISPAITVQSDYYNYEADADILPDQNPRKKLDHKNMNLASTKRDIHPNKLLTTADADESYWDRTDTRLPDDDTSENLVKMRNWTSAASATLFFPNDGKTVVPISDLDLISLLSKMRADGKNYKLQIVKT